MFPLVDISQTVVRLLDHSPAAASRRFRSDTDVVKNREALASALAVDELQLSVERVRGNGGHAGRVAMWVADQDPYATPPVRTPLLAVERWDAWRPVPFGRDARDRRVDLPLVWTSVLIGAIPRQGKTMAARLAAAGVGRR